MKYTFLILSNQPFYSEYKTNKWQIGTRLAKRGHNVVFVDPPLRFKALKVFLKKPSLNLLKLFFSTKKENENLFVYSPANIFNFWPFSIWNTWIHARNINKLISKYGKSDKLVIWVYHFDYPALQNFLTNFNKDILIYDCVDEYTEFPEYSERKTVNTGIISWIQWLDDELKIRINQKGLSGKEWVLHQEKWLSDNADLLFVSAPGLITKFKKWRNDVTYLPNAGSYEMFEEKVNLDKEPEKLKGLPSPRIWFDGAIDSYKVDVNLIEKAAIKYPKYTFVIAGSDKVSDPNLDLSKLKVMKNVKFIGTFPYDEKPIYYSFVDVYTIPYNLNKYTVGGCFPTKYFDALAAGLPTVVTNLPAYEGFDVDGYVSKDDDKFIENIEKALKEDSPQRKQKRKELAKQNSWDGKVDKQLKLISDFLDK